MKSTIIKAMLGLLIVSATIYSLGAYLHVGGLTPDQQKVVALQKQLQAIKDKEEADEKLGQYVLNMMRLSEQSFSKDKHLSEVRKQILAREIVKVTNDVFVTVEQRHAFVAILAIESGFQKLARSPTGPRGLSQVTHAALKDGMAACGLSKFTDEDVWEDTVNLTAGACYFRQQLEDSNDDIFQALVAYNQGPASDSVKTYAKNGSLDKLEPLKYIAKFTYLDKNVTDTKAVDPATVTATKPVITNTKTAAKPVATKTP